jgi:hypothetical protein
VGERGKEGEDKRMQKKMERDERKNWGREKKV